LLAGASCTALASALRFRTADAGACGLVVAVALLPVGAAAAAGAVANVLQNGGICFVGVAAKLERLDPVGGLKRILSRDTIAHSARATAAFASAAAGIAAILTWSIVALLQARGLGGTASTAWIAAREVAAAAAAVGFGFSLAEYGAARAAWLRKLRMSFDERKREAREEEGDATARGHRRALHRALLRSGIGRVKNAAFVVANPTHVAIALEYRPPDVPIPRVLARAADEAALRVRRLAERRGIPVVENAGLARELYRDARLGEFVPRAHYVAVAEVVATLLRLKEIA
jgi:flagellar biosynthesis protein FlhB